MAVPEAGRGDAKDSTRVWRWAPLLLAVLSFNFGSWLVDRVVPADTRGNIGAARRLFEEQADEVELLFLGSSRVQAGIDVGAIEAELRAAGKPLRVFNYGVPGMRTLEQTHLLRQLLERRPERLRWIVLEALPLGITIRHNTDYSRKAEVVTSRSISWHTTRVTRRALAAIWRFPLPPGEQLLLAHHQIDLWARYVWSVGLLSERFLLSSSERAQRERGGARGRATADSEADAEQAPGFGQVLGADKRKRRSHAEVLRSWNERTADQYANRAARIVEKNQLPVDLAELDLVLIEETLEEARAAGIELIWITIPCEVACPEVLRRSEAGRLGPLLHFNDPERYPELFIEELREGIGHLNQDGARLFGRLLVGELLGRRLLE